MGEERYHEPFSCQNRSHLKISCPVCLVLGLLEPLLHDTIECYDVYDVMIMSLMMLYLYELYFTSPRWRKIFRETYSVLYV